MITIEIIIALIIHLAIPVIGFFYFSRIKENMKNENIQNAPTVELFVIFATYGGLLLVALTTLFWKWSGMASLGTFYLILGAPIAMGIIAYRSKQKIKNSKYNNWVYFSSILYFIIAPITFCVLFLVDYISNNA